MVRAMVESTLESHFVGEIAAVMDEIFRRYAEMVDHHVSKYGVKNIFVLVSLIRRETLGTFNCVWLSGFLVTI